MLPPCIALGAPTHGLQVGTVLVIENLRPETTESEIRKLLREIWLPGHGKQMYDAGRGQARTCGVRDKMTERDSQSKSFDRTAKVLAGNHWRCVQLLVKSYLPYFERPPGVVRELWPAGVIAVDLLLITCR